MFIIPNNQDQDQAIATSTFKHVKDGAFHAMLKQPSFKTVKASLASAIAIHEKDCENEELEDFATVLEVRSSLLNAADEAAEFHTECSMGAAMLAIQAFWSV